MLMFLCKSTGLSEMSTTSSAYIRLLILVLPILTPPSSSLDKSSMKIEKRIGLRRQPCLTPLVTPKNSVIPSPPRTADTATEYKFFRTRINLEDTPTL
uniref:Uncharacterized protein n=1 Tax=Panstrongylus lignarius TaxID=156445 RepID=A0A224XUV0_9HEMI